MSPNLVKPVAEGSNCLQLVSFSGTVFFFALGLAVIIVVAVSHGWPGKDVLTLLCLILCKGTDDLV
jgi:hypothetical protein